MADPLAVTLVARAAFTASGEGSSIDAGIHRNALKLLLDVSAMAGSGATLALEVAIQTSLTGTGWATRKTVKVTDVGAYEIIVTKCRRFVRAKYTIAGTTPSFTFEVAGDAHQIYAHPDNLVHHAATQCRLDKFSEDKLAHACFAATDQANEHLARRFTLPLLAYPDSCIRNTALIAIWDAFGSSRNDLNLEGPDGVPKQRAESADAWFSQVGAGERSPTGFQDSTPTKRGAAPRVNSARDERGWHDTPSED